MMQREENIEFDGPFFVACRSHYREGMTTLLPSHLVVGSLVGARRWPYSSAHPDCWGKPWSGQVLAADDPRVWAGSIAFPTDTPDPAAVSAHVKRHAYLLSGDVPVLWSFADHQKVYWERRTSLTSYEADVEAWAQARAAERAAIGSMPKAA